MYSVVQKDAWRRRRQSFRELPAKVGTIQNSRVGSVGSWLTLVLSSFFLFLLFRFNKSFIIPYSEQVLSSALQDVSCSTRVHGYVWGITTTTGSERWRHNRFLYNFRLIVCSFTSLYRFLKIMKTEIQYDLLGPNEPVMHVKRTSQPRCWQESFYSFQNGILMDGSILLFLFYFLQCASQSQARKSSSRLAQVLSFFFSLSLQRTKPSRARSFLSLGTGFKGNLGEQGEREHGSIGPSQMEKGRGGR